MFLRLATRVVACMAAVSDVAGQSPEPTIHRLTVTGARNGQGFWSPDGRSIAFVSNRTGAWQVWIMSATRSDARQLTNSERAVGWPSWAPDGRSIVYYADTPTGSQCFRILVAGGSAEPFHHDAFRDFRPLLNHDGTQLLFDRFGATTPANHDVFVRRLRDNSVRQLTNDPGYDSDARWSPDGRSIVWHSDRGSATRYHTQIYVMDADGTNVRALTSGPATAGYPSWSPDGRWIAYTLQTGGNRPDRDVWIMRADGSNRRRVTTYAGFDGDPVWSPSSDKLLISTSRFGGEELAVLDIGR